MPRWARFLSCSFTGLLIEVGGFFAAAYWYEGRPGFWRAVIDFTATGAFWSLVALFALLAMVTLLLARVIVNLYRLTGTVAGALAGAAVAFIFAVFLIATHAADWGGMAAALHRAWPAAAIFALPVAGAGGFVTWLWDRLD